MQSQQRCVDHLYPTGNKNRRVAEGVIRTPSKYISFLCPSHILGVAPSPVPRLSLVRHSIILWHSEVRWAPVQYRLLNLPFK